MTSMVWLNIPLAVLVILAIVGIPLWMTFRRPDRHPGYAEARTHFQTKAARARGQAVTVGGHVLAAPERPVRRPAVARRRPPGRPATVRSHAPATPRSTRASA
jgi:hypothetical protein